MTVTIANKIASLCKEKSKGIELKSGCSDGKESARNAGDPARFNPWGQEDPLEKGMTTHSSILAWRIP